MNFHSLLMEIYLRTMDLFLKYNIEINLYQDFVML